MKTFKTLIFIIIFYGSVFSQNNIDFSSKTLDNKEFSLSEVTGKNITLVSFWALWCKPCRAEMRHLENLYNSYKEKGFAIVGINQDSPRSLAKVKSFVASHNVTFPIVLDPNQEIFQKFNGQSIPLTVLFNNKGEIIYTHIGYLPGDEIELEEEIKKALGE